MKHEHITKVLKWGLNDKYEYIGELYGCTECEETSPVPFVTEEVSTGHSEHTDYVDGCFACKIKTLELSPGDAGYTENSYTKKSWESELQAYRDARAQGIQPAGTTRKHIQQAYDASDKLGKAYDADVMPAASKITKQVAAVAKETGAI
jgi:hypothetical protein